jgi:hypothetical protein
MVAKYGTSYYVPLALGHEDPSLRELEISRCTSRLHFGSVEVFGTLRIRCKSAPAPAGVPADRLKSSMVGKF